MTLFFPPIDSLTYIYKSYIPLANVQTFIDVINTRSKIYDNYYHLMCQRMDRYPNLQYVFLTKNSEQEIKSFLDLYPRFKSVNVAVYSTSIQQLVNITQIPFCIILNEKQNIVYKGGITTDNYSILISHLNVLKRPKKQLFVDENSVLLLQNKQLSLLLGGLQSKSLGALPKLNLSSSRSKLEVNNSVELSQASLPFIKNLENLSLPNNNEHNVKAVNMVNAQRANKLRESMMQQEVDEWAD
ncbi:Conserved_hypothetical protein [Hexamita inflata]|uniref:Uncharacterized protein n=1 Tax=Hexamita inflata TaxID=28002 RepID=A0ABP1H495_9EUKA